MVKITATHILLRTRILKATRAHFYLLLAYAGAIIAFDSWNLYTHENILQRWTYGGIFAITVCLLWFVLKKYAKNTTITTAVAYVLIASGIVFAAFNVYIDRGMASKAVMLFAIPLLVAAQLKSRSALLATAGVSVAAYSIAAVRYFYEFYGEGLRVQLYGELGFYSAVIFVIALLLLPLIAVHKK